MGGGRRLGVKAAAEDLRPQGEWIFGRALCGIDDSTESLDALLLLLLLAPPDMAL